MTLTTNAKTTYTKYNNQRNGDGGNKHNDNNGDKDNNHGDYNNRIDHKITNTKYQKQCHQEQICNI